MAEPRRLDPQWDGGLIAASIAVSLLGAFTSTQLMCQARMCLRISSIAVWTALGSLTFGFCSIWCLHFVAMLACKLDLPIGINVFLTILSAILAVFFTFLALASDFLLEKYRISSHRPRRLRKTRNIYRDIPPEQDLSQPLMSSETEEEDTLPEQPSADDSTLHPEPSQEVGAHLHTRPTPAPRQSSDRSTINGFPKRSRSHSSTGSSASTGSSTITSSSHGSTGLRDFLNVACQTTVPAKNAFVATGERLYSGCTSRNIIKGFLWSLAITSMHYVGILALRIPQGHVTFNPFLVVLSAAISWLVCLVGCILISKIETNLTQQLLFAAVASAGVAAMHFTGKAVVLTYTHALQTDSCVRHGCCNILVVRTAVRESRLPTSTGRGYRQHCHHHLHCGQFSPCPCCHRITQQASRDCLDPERIVANHCAKGERRGCRCGQERLHCFGVS